MASRKSHSNVLQHILGHLKRNLDGDDKHELNTIITQYKSGTVPLVVPMTLLQHHFKRFHDPYIDQQVFMRPYPEQLSLRNSI